MREDGWASGAVGFDVVVVELFNFEVEDGDAFRMRFIFQCDEYRVAAAGVVELVAGVEVFGLDPVASLTHPERMLVRGFDRLSFLRHRIVNRQNSQMRGDSPKRIEYFSSRHFPSRRIPRDDFFTRFDVGNRFGDVAW